MSFIIKRLVTVFFIILFCLSSDFVWARADHVITDYHQTFVPGYNNKNELRIAIRMYYFDNTLYYLVVNPQNFATESIPVVDFRLRKAKKQTTPYAPMDDLMATPYMKAVAKYTLPPYVLQNYGAKHAETHLGGVFLTVDLCPSINPFEKNFFATLVRISELTNKPFPVAISISGLWIIFHGEEFEWLLKQVKEKKLEITWVNHSFSHPYYEDLPLEQSFLLEPHTNVDAEILATEKLLLEHEQLPSVFFRFPGLVSNEELVLKLYKYGLIPVGTDAWLAKDEIPQAGSFILVHGNSNEPQGIEKLMPLLRDKNQQWLSLPRQAFKQ